MTQNLAKSKHDIIGVGNALVDVHISLKNNDIAALGLKSGETKLISEEIFSRLCGITCDSAMFSGGACANSAAVASSLGISCAYIGQVGDDQAGTVFLSSMLEYGVQMLREPLQKSTETPKTGMCFMIKDSDGQLAKAIYLGASSRLFSVDINTAAMLDARFLLAEGYLFEYQSNQKYLTELLKFAKACRLTVVCTLPDKAVIEKYRRVILKALEFIDILIGNESEIECLFPSNDVIKSLAEGLIFSPPTLFIATLGHKGAAAAIHQDIIIVKPNKISSIVDKDGVGDAFAAGFLYGRIKGLTLKQSLKTGNICATEIIGQQGHLPKTSLLPLLQSV